MADDVSAIPRYMTGGAQAGGAGRTASGLSMLMSNAAKTLQMWRPASTGTSSIPCSSTYTRL